MGNISSEPTIYGGGCGGYGGGFGFGGFPAFGAIGLFGAFNGSGFGYGNGAGAAAVGGYELRNEILQQTIAEMQAIGSAKDSLSNQIGEVSESINSGFSSVNSTLANGFAQVAAIEQQARYDAAIQNCQQTNLLVSTMTAGFQSIKDELTQSKIADLERQLAVAENGGPIVRAGAFVPFNPCHHNDRINQLEQVIVQVGSKLNAIEKAGQK